MKTLFKLLLLGMLLASFAAKATDVSTAATAAATNNIFTGSGRVQSIIIANDVASALTVKFFDAPSTNLTYSLGAYTNYLSYTTNIVTSYITPAGVTQLTTNSGVFTYANTVASSTPAYRTVATLNLAASTSMVYYPTNGLIVTFGLSVTNNTNCTITTTYWPSK